MAKQPARKSSHKVVLDRALCEGGGMEQGAVMAAKGFSLDVAQSWEQVEDAFFQRGVEEEKAAIELYATLPGKLRPEGKERHLRGTHVLWAACAIGLAAVVLTLGPRLFRGESGMVANVSIPAQAEKLSAADTPSTPTPAAPAPAVATSLTPAPVAPVLAVTELASPGPEPVQAVPAPALPVAAPLALEAKMDLPSATLVAKAEPTVVPAAVDKNAVPADATKANLALAKAASPTVANPIEPGSEVAICRLGLEKRLAKSINEACANALSTDKSLIRPLLKWTRAELERGRTAVAALWANRLVEVDPMLADAYVIIGVAEQTSNRIASARTAYKRYLELAPKGAFARDVRSALTMM